MFNSLDMWSIIDSAKNIPWGAPNPLKAVFDDKFVAHVYPDILTWGIWYVFVKWETHLSTVYETETLILQY